jgi:hypothetical protein
LTVLVMTLMPLLLVLAGIVGQADTLVARSAAQASLSQTSGGTAVRRTRAFVIDEGNAATIYVGLIGLRGGEKADLQVFTIEPARHKGEFLVGLPLVTSRDPLRVPAAVPLYIGLKYVQDPPARTGSPVTVICGASVTLTARFSYNVLCDVDAHLMIVRLG